MTDYLEEHLERSGALLKQVRRMEQSLPGPPVEGEPEGSGNVKKNLKVSADKVLDREKKVWYNPRKTITERAIGKKRTFAGSVSYTETIGGRNHGRDSDWRNLD